MSGQTDVPKSGYTQIERLLIANRGEIAVRIARSAHGVGITTVGVYSEPDVNALHVDQVDVAVSLGGSTAAESYLKADAVIEIALAEGCDALHPGYGFLAENADFARQVIEAGLVWIGPTPENIELLGDKIAAKQAAVGAGVPTTPVITVSLGSVPGDVPMPALVKAAAGGGGRGMRIVRDPDDLADAVEAAGREAEAAFGDSTVFVEPFIERGRHIEVQIMGDGHGNVIHFGERECSIQRRNQKILEEAPSAGITPEVRQQLTQAAVDLGRSVGYESAGTVEFLVAEDGAIIFLEVNTRIQVEHPVTEAVTGLDLIGLQLLVATGKPLPLTQQDVVITGHAIEARIVAEDPVRGWLPSTGVITAFDLRGQGHLDTDTSIRVDTGFQAGAEVSSDYDSLLAKVIVHGPDRLTAARLLARSLRGSQVAGVRTNLACLQAILTEPDFLRALTPTSYLDEHPDVLVASGPTGHDQLAHLLAAVFAVESRNRNEDRATGFAPSGWRNLRTRGQRISMRLDEIEHQVEYEQTASGAEVLVGPWPVPTADGTLSVDERLPVSVRLFRRDGNQRVLEVDGRRQIVDVDFDGPWIHTRSRAGALSWSVPERFPVPKHEQPGDGPVSPLPGKVIAVHVEVGQQVRDGDLLMVLEAMKMEHRIEAVGDAVVAGVHFGVGDGVDTGDLLVTLESIARSVVEEPAAAK